MNFSGPPRSPPAPPGPAPGARPVTRAGSRRGALAAREPQHRDRADALGLLRVLAEPGHALDLLGVDAVPLVAGQLGDGDRVAARQHLDGGLARRYEVVVPVRVGRRAALGG